MSIKFEITRAPELLGEYFQLWENCYRKELNLPDFDGSEEPSDKVGHILIASRKGRCLGGARIVAANQADIDLVSCTSSIGKVSFRAGKPCLWERLSVAPDARCDDLLQFFCGHLVNTSWELGYDCALMVSSSKNARYYRRFHSRWGVPFETLSGTSFQPKGTFAELEHVVSAARLQPLALSEQVVTQAPPLAVNYQNRLAA